MSLVVCRCGPKFRLFPVTFKAEITRVVLCVLFVVVRFLAHGGRSSRLSNWGHVSGQAVQGVFHVEGHAGSNAISNRGGHGCCVGTHRLVSQRANGYSKMAVDRGRPKARPKAEHRGQGP